MSVPLIPGKELTPEQKAQLAKENAAASAEAQRMAADHIARDRAQGGHEKPIVPAVADSILAKLQGEQFEKKPGAPTVEEPAA